MKYLEVIQKMNNIKFRVNTQFLKYYFFIKSIDKGMSI